MNIKKAILWIVFWIGCALAFNAGIYVFSGEEKALAFLGGYIIEFSLSIDNLFLFLLIFQNYKIPPLYQRRVLGYGIIGAVILRLIFILLGVSIVNRFHWILYIFGGVLIISGIKMMLKKEENIKGNIAIRTLSKIMPVTNKLYGEKFFVSINKVLYATPLLGVLVLIEFSDILFAVDSIPAIFSITTDLFIVYASNIFAILGLRNLYFILEKLHETFVYVKYGVAVILCFTGMKLLILFFNLQISTRISLLIIFGILVSSILISVMLSEKGKGER